MAKGYSIGDYILLIFIPPIKIIWFVLMIQYCMIATFFMALMKFDMPNTIKINISLPYIKEKNND